MFKKFEYCHFSSQVFPLNKLNTLGQQGWELVSENYLLSQFHYIFKREITEEIEEMNRIANEKMIEDEVQTLKEISDQLNGI